MPSSTEKQILQQAGLGLKKVRFFVDDSEEEVVKKLTSDEPGDDGIPNGFPQLKEGKGFELMSCMTNSRDLAVVKSSWSVEGLKTLFTPQTKIYLRPIQKNLRVKGGQENRLTCKLTEKCMWCSQEFPLNELRTHSVTCNCNVFGDNAEEDIEEVVVSADQSSSVLEDYTPNILSSATVTGNDVESLSTDENDTVSPSLSVPGNHSLVVPDIGSNPVLIQPSPDKLDVDLKLIIPEIKEHCRSTGLFVLFLFFFTMEYLKVESLRLILIGHFTVVYSVTWPMNGSEAAGDLVLIQTSLFLSCVVVMLTSLHLHKKIRGLY